MKEGWGYKKLNELCEVITKGTTPTTLGYTFSEVGINFIKIESISTNRKLLRDKLNHISEECNKSMSRSQLQESDLLFSIAGALGRIYIVEKSVLPANTNQALAIIRLKNKQDLFLRYLSYYLSSNTLKRQIDKDKVGVAQLNLSLSQIKNFVIPIPSIKVQQHIVEELDLLSSIIEKKKAQLNELDNLAQSLFYEMFGDPIMNEKGWKVKKLGEVGKFINGDRGKNYPSQKDFVDNGIPFINAGHIKKNHVDMETMNYISREKFEKLGSGKIQDGDILFCLRGSLGKKAIVKNLTEGAIASSLVIIRVVDANINYISFYLESDAVKKEILKNNNGSSQPNLSAKSVASFHVPVPPLELQQRFAEKVESIERQKELIKKSIKEVETLFNSRMDYYFN